MKQWGEYPIETKRRKRRYNKLRGKVRTTKLVTRDVLDCLMKIIESHPEYYLDEIQFDLLHEKGAVLSVGTLWNTLTEKFNYSM